MAKKVILKGDLSAGSDGYKPTPAIEGNEYFTVNGKPVVTVGCHYQDHEKIKDGGWHRERYQSEGTSKIFINGIEVAISGDKISCGDTAGEGTGFEVET
nr:MAG TPA: Baseplate wedge protein [Caudoviricetes sp.]